MQTQSPAQIAIKVAVAELNRRGYACYVQEVRGEPGIRPAHSFPKPEVMMQAIAKGWVTAGVPNHEMSCCRHVAMEGGALLCRKVTAVRVLADPYVVCRPRD